MNAGKQLVVTGAQGFVAGSVLCQADDDWGVHAISRGVLPARRSNRQWHVCDPLAPREFAQLFQKIRPQVVIHTAALADIDLCQAQPELARAVNIDYTRSLVMLCADAGTRLVFCSTDTVFDGEHAPYCLVLSIEYTLGAKKGTDQLTVVADFVEILLNSLL